LVITARVPKKWRSQIARVLQEDLAVSSVEAGIAGLASRMLDGIECPPTPQEEMCRTHGISIAASDELMGSGALVKHGENYQILYATDLSPARRRFTIGHELGHFALDRLVPVRVPQSKELERLCDMFATELLMPKGTFLREIGADFHLGRLSSLAHRFKVSLTTAAIRVAEVTGSAIFEADKSKVHWGVGLVGRGSVARMDETLKHSIVTAEGRNGVDQIYLTIAESVVRCSVEHLQIGSTGRFIFLIRRLPLK
jgi:hypothetical protein